MSVFPKLYTQRGKFFSKAEARRLAAKGEPFPKLYKKSGKPATTKDIDKLIIPSDLSDKYLENLVENYYLSAKSYKLYVKTQGEHPLEMNQIAEIGFAMQAKYNAANTASEEKAARKFAYFSRQRIQNILFNIGFTIEDTVLTDEWMRY